MDGWMDGRKALELVLIMRKGILGTMRVCENYLEGRNKLSIHN